MLATNPGSFPSDAKRPTRQVGARLARGLSLILGMPLATPWFAPPQPVHTRFNHRSPPGSLGAYQLTRGGPLPGYFQPVEFRGPPGLRIAMVVDGQFEPLQSTPTTMGLLISPVYRFRVTGIPLHEGREVFPTIEIVNRLYPPAGRAWEFAVPVELTFQDLLLAL
ncbi:MAG: hypothetical protein N2C14_31660, partial [Planctomycetales bacterium]